MYRITFVVDAYRGPQGNPVAARCLQIMTTALTMMNADYLRAHPEIPNVEDATRNVIRVVESRSGVEDWKDIPTMFGTRVATRRDIACWLAAEERVRRGHMAWPKSVSWPSSARVTYFIDLFKGQEEQELSHKALNTLLMALMMVNVESLKTNPSFPLLYESGVRYEEEPVGQEDWQDAFTSLRMGFADCEDLACWLAAEYRVRFDVQAVPTFTYKVRANGSYLYHITVGLPDGRVEDPSRRLGMR